MDILKQLTSATHYCKTIYNQFANERYSEEGKLSIELVAADSITTQEVGQLVTSHTKHKTYNCYQWQFQTNARLYLSHLRYQQAELLAEFDLQQENTMQAESPYYCGEDCYQAKLICRANVIELCWQINGPDKRLQIRTSYR